MTQTRALDVTLTAPVGVVLRRSGQSGDAEVRAAQYMSAFHDRHVPLPPGLARSLARMETARTPAEDPRLGRAWDRASDILGHPQSLGRNEAWAPLTWSFALLIVEPLLRQAALRIGTLFLTSQTEVPETEENWESYEAKLGTELDGLLGTTEAMGAPFWAQAGVALLAAFHDAKRRRARDTSAGTLRLPVHVGTLLPALVFVSEPELAPRTETTRPPQRMTQRAQRDRTAIRPREGGVTGILQTRRIEDINDALPSTFVVPPQLRMIRLLEEGYPITNRPPQRTPDRDLLSMAFHDDTQATPAAEIAKAAWLDAALRLRFILSRMGQAKSELGWLDLRLGTPASALSAAELTDIPRLDPLQLSGQPRRRMVTSSHLFPDVFAALPLTMRAGGGAEMPPADPVAALLEAAARASASIRRPGLRNAGGIAPRRFTAEAYSKRLLLHITPGTVQGDELQPSWYGERRELLRRYNIPQTLDCHVAMLMLPDKIEAGGPGFRMLSDSAAETSTIAPDPDLEPEAALNTLLGQLSRWFIDKTIEALHG